MYNYEFHDGDDDSTLWLIPTVLLPFLIVVLIILSLCSCKQYVPYKEYHTQYVVRTDTVKTQDSVLIRDSTFIFCEGDTKYVYKYLYKDRWRDNYKVRLDTIIRHDSIPYPVERKLTKTEQRYITLGKYASGGIIGLLFAACMWLAIWWYRKKV